MTIVEDTIVGPGYERGQSGRSNPVRRRRAARRVVVLALAGLVAIVLAGCGSTPSTGQAITKVDASTAVSMLDSRTIIDVRTPAEYAAGHLTGARNIDVEDAAFTTAISTLDKGGAYLVYCQSGRRSALAAEQMAASGFTDIVDGGALSSLVAAGAPSQ